ncbi:hypothetical protein N9999_01320 [bacterium]|nr:hypothetical protein [bacterium]
MKTISVFVFWVFAALVFLSGCQSDPPKEEVEIEGQVFVVTKGRENIKMGLTPIYVLSDEEFQKIAAELAEEIQAFRVEGIQREANWEARTKFIRELLAMEGRELAESALEALRMEAARPSSEYVVKNRFLVHEDLERSKVLLFSMIPAATTKTDADGKFKISVSSKSWVIAQGQRSVGKESEDYLWIAPIGEPEKAAKSSLLISNDSGYDSTEELYALLNSVSASGSDVLPAVGSGEVDQETAQWIREANEKAKQAIRMAEQAAEAEMEARDLELAPIRESLSYESLKLKSGGTVVSWGRFDILYNYDVPSGLTDVVGVAAGGSHSLALKKDGTVVAWGDNDENQCDVPSGLTDVVGIGAGYSHSLALKKDGTVVAWGLYDAPSGLTDVVEISVGSFHNLALKKDGTVVAWGDNNYNQCDVPSGLTDAVGIAAGYGYSLALKKDGTVVAWGNNYENQCDVPSGLTDAVGIAAGSGHSLALKKDGTVVAWGDNDQNQCDVPSGLTDGVGIVAGSGHSLALKKDGTVVAWGSNRYNQCDVPSGLTDVVGIAASGSHDLALKLAKKN